MTPAGPARPCSPAPRRRAAARARRSSELARPAPVRAEWRAGGQWVELAHDRLIGPIAARTLACASAARASRGAARRLDGHAAADRRRRRSGCSSTAARARRARPRAVAALADRRLSRAIDAPAEAVARWMGRAAQAGRDAAAELPVMSALVESGLHEPAIRPPRLDRLLPDAEERLEPRALRRLRGPPFAAAPLVHQPGQHGARRVGQGRRGGLRHRPAPVRALGGRHRPPRPALPRALPAAARRGAPRSCSASTASPRGGPCRAPRPSPGRRRGRRGRAGRSACRPTSAPSRRRS